MLDATLKLDSHTAAAEGAAAAIVDAGTAVNIGRTGIHRNTQFVASVANADADRGSLFVDLELTLDNTFATADATGVNPTINTIATLHFEQGFKGVRTADVGRAIPWQKYAAASIDVRSVIRSPSDAQAADYGLIECFLGSSNEGEYYGRLATADTLATDI